MFSTKLLSVVSAAALISLATASDPTTTKNTLFPNGIGDFFNPPMMKLPIAGYTVKQWPWGTLPKTCFDQAPKDGGNYCNVYDIDVFDVTYNDVSHLPFPMEIHREGRTDGKSARNHGPFVVATMRSSLPRLFLIISGKLSKYL